MTGLARIDAIQYEIVHAIPGRLRVRIEELRAMPGFAEGFSKAFMARAGIESVRVNRWCASAVIHYDPTVLTLHDARRALESTPRLPATPAALIKSEPSPPPPTGAAAVAAVAERAAPPSAQLAVSGAAFLAGLLGIPAAITTPLLAAAIAPIMGRALRAGVQEKKVGVDALDATAATLLVMQGSAVAAGFMTTLVSLGEFIRDRTARRSQAMMADLLGLAGRSAWVVHGSKRVRVPAEQVRVGEVVVVYPGDMVPVDGVVLRGQAAVDQRSLTGESMPVEIGPGSEALAATVLVEGKIYIRCTAAGHQTRAGLAMDAVKTAPVYETRTQNYASLVADRLVLPIFLTAGVSFALTHNVTRAISILIIDFATGVRISAPTAVLASMQRAARRGILIKGGGALERLAKVDAIIFDKTGTLTRGEPEVTEVIASNGLSPSKLLSLAAAAEQRLRHPAARAIVRHARKEGVAIPERGESNYTLGMGIRADVNGASILVGSRKLMEAEGIDLGPVKSAKRVARGRGESLGYVAVDGEITGFIAYADPLRSEAKDVIAALKRRGVREIVMVTGDNEAPARAAAAEAGITRVVAGAFPERKAQIVQELKAKGRTVAVVGDGINDSPALAHADVAISLHGGADVARERADVVLTDDDLRRLPEAVDIARGAMGLVRQNLTIVAVPNAAGLALATAGLMGPALATLINNGSAIVAALNSLRPLLAGTEVPLEQSNGNA